MAPNPSAGFSSSHSCKLMIDALAGARVPVAIITNSWLMRGSGIAVGWFNPSLKVAPP